MGAAAARNKGVEKATGDYIVFFDSDVILAEDTLLLFEKSFFEGKIIVVGSYFKEPANKGFFPKIKGLIYESWIPKGNSASVFGLAVAGIKKTVFLSCDGFNENIKKASIEDYEFSDRLLKDTQNHIFYHRHIKVWHNHPSSFFKQCKLFYIRSRDISSLIIRRRFKLYNFSASGAEGFSSVLGVMLILFFIYALIRPSHFSVSFSAIIFMGYVYFNRTFIKIIFSEKNFCLTLCAFFLRLFLSIPIVFGFLVGSVKYFVVNNNRC